MAGGCSVVALQRSGSAIARIRARFTGAASDEAAALDELSVLQQASVSALVLEWEWVLVSYMTLVSTKQHKSCQRASHLQCQCYR